MAFQVILISYIYFFFKIFHSLIVFLYGTGSLPGIAGFEYSGSTPSMPSHVTTTSSNNDSFSKENQPLKRRQRVRFFIQMIIEKIFIIPIQAEDIPVIEHPANEITQEAIGGSRSPSTRGLGVPMPT